MTTLAYRFLVRGGTAANLALVNEIPLARELVFETDTRKWKLGNGITAYNSLPYGGGGSAGIEMQVAGGYIQFRNVGDVSWTNVISVASITGAPGANGTNGTNGTNGRNPEFQKTSTHLQWRLVGDPTWINLVALADIKGDAGIPSQRRVQEITGASGSVACDWSLYDEIRIAMVGHVTLTFSGANDGQGCVVKLKQPAGGDKTVALPASVRFNDLLISYSHTGGPNIIDKVGFVYDDTDTKYDFVSIIPGIG